MAMIEISVVPVGTGSTSVSTYVAGAIRVLEADGVKYQLTAMGTIIEGDLEHLLALAGRMHRSALESGAMRVVTTIKIDERSDHEISIEGKVKAVKEHLK